MKKKSNKTNKNLDKDLDKDLNLLKEFIKESSWTSGHFEKIAQIKKAKVNPTILVEDSIKSSIESVMQDRGYKLSKWDYTPDDIHVGIFLEEKDVYIKVFVNFSVDNDKFEAQFPYYFHFDSYHGNKLESQIYYDFYDKNIFKKAETAFITDVSYLPRKICPNCGSSSIAPHSGNVDMCLSCCEYFGEGKED